MKPIIKIIHDTRRTKQNEKYPVKLRITFLRQQKYYPIRIDLTVKEFEYVQNPGNIPKYLDLATKRQLKDWKLKCDAVEVKAASIIERIDEFTFRKFEKKFYLNQQSADDVYHWYEVRIEK